MMSTDSFHEALAFIEKNLDDGPLVHVVRDGGKRIMGYVVAMNGPGGFVIEPATAGHPDRVEIDLTCVSELKVIVPGRAVCIFK